MKTKLAGVFTSLVLAAASSGTLAAEVTITGWAFGSGHSVQASGSGIAAGSYNGSAGGFTGSLTGAGSFNTKSFLTYCIELEETLSFGNSAMSGYSVVPAAKYFADRRTTTPSRPDGTGVATRLGQLVTWASADPKRVDTAAESTAMQLAIWNIVYDSDWSVTPTTTTTGSFRDSSSYESLATQMLQSASTVTNLYDVYALTRVGSQDLLLTKPSTGVPAPATLALVGLALAGAVMVLRRRR